MNEMNRQKQEDKLKENLPAISFSDEFLSIKVEEGIVYRGHLRLESSDRKVPIVGKVYSTNDKLVPEVEQFKSSKVDIPFYFKGKLATKGSLFEGDFVFVTNMGEYNIPYTIEVVNRSMETSMGRIETLEEFSSLYQKERKEAMALFFLPAFPKVFLKDDPYLIQLYKNFQKGRKKAVIVEEFLAAAGYKPTAKLAVEQSKIILDAGREEAEIVLKMETDGYLEGFLKSEKDQIYFSKTTFTSDDFVHGRLIIRVTQDPKKAVGSDLLIINTARQTFEIPVEWWGTLNDREGEIREKQRINRYRADLMHNYLSFRTGSIGFDDFIQETLPMLDDLIYQTKDTEWNLYKTHVLLMEEKKEEAKGMLEELAQMEAAGNMSLLHKNYFKYLKALYYKSAESIGSAVMSVRELYENSSYKAQALWMLIYLDREYVYNKRLSYDTIKQLFEEGCSSSFLYFEACDILNDNPSFMEELGSFEMSIFSWGVRYGYVSMSLAQQFVRLALKVKFFKRSIFHIALRLYKVEPDERFLLLICSLLIKGNKTSKKYHSFFRDGIEANLKLIGLNEFFIRSTDFDSYELIPQKVLIYFTYSNSLDSLEKAYLYVNILKNQDYYEEVYGTYQSKMLPFIQEQLMKGNINEHLAYLYTYFMDDILEDAEYARMICDVLFYQKLVCHNPNIVGVYVSYPETGQEKYYGLSSGTAKIEIFNHRTKIYFVNSEEQRFCEDIDYSLIPFIDLSRLSEEWISRNQNNKKIILMQSEKLDETIEEEALDMAQKIYSDDSYASWIRERAIEALLLYYGNHRDMEQLRRWLERTDYSAITTAFREKLIGYYLQAGMIENAFFGIELYGSQIVHCSQRLAIAEFGITYYKGEKDETTLSLAYDGFLRKCCSKETLCYLIEHFEGELGDYLTLWERSRQLELDTQKLEERILLHCVFTKTHSDAVYSIFEKYYQKDQDSKAAISYLEYTIKGKQTLDKLPVGIQMIIGEEIVKNRICDRSSKIHFLYYFADKPQYMDQISDTAAHIIEDLLEQDIYLPIYHTYEKVAVLPVEYKEMTFLTYRGESKRDVRLYYSLKGLKKRVFEKKLEEISSGHYVCSLHFFRSDHVTYRLEADKERVTDDSALKFETFDYGNTESRFFALNQLAAQPENIEDIEAYLKMVYFTEHHMILL